jgi:hypothetical protein
VKQKKLNSKEAKGQAWLGETNWYELGAVPKELD